MFAEMRFLAILVGLFGCSSKPAGPSCADVAANVAALRANDPDVAGMGSGFRDILRAHCESDHWSVPLRKCLLAIRSTDQIESCQAHITAAQEQALTVTVKASRTPGVPAMVPKHPALSLTVGPNGKVLIGSRPIEDEALDNIIAEAVKSDPETNVLLRVDSSTDPAVVAPVIERIKRGGLTHIGIAPNP